MPWKNDLSAYKIGLKTALPKEPQANESSLAWRKAKPASEKQSMTISLRFTPSEYEYIKNKAWLVQMGTYVKHLLNTQTDLFD